MDKVKEDMNNLSDDLKTIKISMGDLVNRINDNKAQIDEILNELKERKNNLNLANNLASISPASKPTRKGGDEFAHLDQMQEDLDDLKHLVDSKLLEIDIKLEMISNNNPEIANFNKKLPEEKKKSLGERSNAKLKTLGPNKIEFGTSSNQIGISQLMKRMDEVDKNNREMERSFKRLLSSFNVNDVLDDIAKLKDSKADKADIPDADSFNYLLDDVKSKMKTHDVEIKEINQRLDNVLAKMVSQENSKGVQNIDIFDKELLQIYLTKDDFDNNMKGRDEEFQKVKKDLQKAKDYLSQLMNGIKKKVDVVDFTNTKGILNEKIEELARACNLKFADKNESLKNFKHIEEQLKKILYILKKRTDQNSEGDGNWLIAKKPIQGYSCAACESYIGELNKDVKKYVPWNRLPFRENGENLYRLGNGYSKMLQMINFDINGNVNLSPDTNEDIHTIISNDSNGMNSFNIKCKNNNQNNQNNNNIMGKTFYPKQKTIQSKTPIKLRVNSARDGFVERNSNISIKNNNNLEENKNNIYLVNAVKTRNTKGFPKINSLEGESSIQKDPIITKIVKKSQSKSIFRIKGTKI